MDSWRTKAIATIPSTANSMKNSNTKALIAGLYVAAMSSATTDFLGDNESFHGSVSYPKTQLNKKQLKARAKSKKARKQRRRKK